MCQVIEHLTGWKVLPVVEEKKKKSKAERRKSTKKEREVTVEEAVSVGGSTKKKRRRKLSEKGDADDADGVTTTVAVAQKKKKRRRSAADPKSSTKVDTKKDPATTPPEKAAATPSATTTARPKKPDAASQKFLANDIKSSNPNYRVQRELKAFLAAPPPGLSVKISGKNVRLWVVTLAPPPGTIYAGERYRLRVQFPRDYPTSPPSVYFLSPTPRHEHVYTNGDICLSLLGRDWRPIMTAQMVAESILSILCGAQQKSLPMDNAGHAVNKPGKKQDNWVYHDDNC